MRQQIVAAFEAGALFALERSAATGEHQQPEALRRDLDLGLGPEGGAMAAVLVELPP